LVDVAITRGVSLLAHQTSTGIVVPGVDLLVIVGLALFANQNATGKYLNFVRATVAVEARLAPGG